MEVAMQETVDMAGTECFIQSIGESFDLFGMDCVDQLAAVFEMLGLSYTLQPNYNVVVTSGRSFLFFCKSKWIMHD